MGWLPNPPHHHPKSCRTTGSRNPSCRTHWPSCPGRTGGESVQQPAIEKQKVVQEEPIVIAQAIAVEPDQPEASAEFIPVKADVALQPVELVAEPVPVAQLPVDTYIVQLDFIHPIQPVHPVQPLIAVPVHISHLDPLFNQAVQEPVSLFPSS